jgi:hypothetical protein
VDELAKGQFGQASVYLETNKDLHMALVLINESLENFQRQGMQYEIRKSLSLQEAILLAQPQDMTLDHNG